MCSPSGSGRRQASPKVQRPSWPSCGIQCCASPDLLEELVGQGLPVGHLRSSVRCLQEELQSYLGHGHLREQGHHAVHKLQDLQAQ